ncbi:MAG: LuxR family transcriptional regulator [bacterium]|nr:LuxR family transcriptional regulator [bacterium]
MSKGNNVNNNTINKYERDRLKLIERVKELNCLYGFAEIIENETSGLKEIYQRVVDIVPSGWQYPDITCARITISEEIYISDKFRSSKWRQAEKIRVNNQLVGELEVFYIKKMPDIYEGPFLKEERNLINNLCERLGRMIHRHALADELKKSGELLQVQKNILEQKNIALNELLFQIERGKKEAEENIKSNIETLLLPVLEKMKMDSKNDIHFDLIIKAIREINSSFCNTLKSRFKILTPREVEICQLLKNGLSSKEVAYYLMISPQTINKHRFNIRRKLGVSGEKINLVSFLNSFE